MKKRAKTFDIEKDNFRFNLSIPKLEVKAMLILCDQAGMPIGDFLAKLRMGIFENSGLAKNGVLDQEKIESLFKKDFNRIVSDSEIYFTETVNGQKANGSGATTSRATKDNAKRKTKQGAIAKKHRRVRNRQGREEATR